MRRSRTSVRASLRPYRRSDDPGLSDVCLRTADDGSDATDKYRRQHLPASVYAWPYVRFEPDLCFVVDDGTRAGRVSGYVLGTSDTAAFEQWCERAWWPGVRDRYPADAQPAGSADRRLAAMAAAPRPTPRRISDRYPAHLHVDLLPQLQGQGLGRSLLERFMAAAASNGATGVHLGVSTGNDRAIGFYARLGFHLVEHTDDALVLGRRLD
jgi:ribosomal protein S18 acetylase RimI-like enzyme